jgi:chromate transport protein ChrA
MATALSKDEVTVIILLIGEASGVFAGFCPSWFTVASPFFHEQEAKAGNIKRIRQGEAAATAIVLATGWAVSSRQASNSAWWASVAISAIFVAGYEYQIRHPSKED